MCVCVCVCVSVCVFVLFKSKELISERANIFFSVLMGSKIKKTYNRYFGNVKYFVRHLFMCIQGKYFL